MLNITGEWYSCNNLLYLLRIIDKKINVYDIKTEITLLNNIEIYTERNIIQKNFIRIINKNNKQNIFINYNIFFLYNLNEFNYEFDKVTIDDIKYLHYKNFVNFLYKNIKDEKSRKLIINKINNDIKRFIYKMDKFFLKLININKIFFHEKFNLPTIKIYDYIDIQLNCFYICEKSLLYSSKEYLIKNKTEIFKNIDKNIIYFINRIKIEYIVIKIIVGKETIFYTIDEYINKFRKILSLTKQHIKIYKRIYYNFDFVSLNRYLNTKTYYKLLNLEDNNLFKYILNDNLYEDINIYIKKNVINIKKFTLYQILNKKNYKKDAYLLDKYYIKCKTGNYNCNFVSNENSYCERCIDYATTCVCGNFIINDKGYIIKCNSCELDSYYTTSEDEKNNY